MKVHIKHNSMQYTVIYHLPHLNEHNGSKPPPNPLLFYTKQGHHSLHDCGNRRFPATRKYVWYVYCISDVTFEEPWAACCGEFSIEMCGNTLRMVSCCFWVLENSLMVHTPVCSSRNGLYNDLCLSHVALKSRPPDEETRKLEHVTDSSRL